MNPREAAARKQNSNPPRRIRGTSHGVGSALAWQAAGDAEAKKYDRLRMEIDTLKAEVCTRTTRAWMDAHACKTCALQMHARTHADSSAVLGALL